ncbi:MAG: tyrosine-type recombinase/integrase [Oscillospiraceae bacterium]|jgi:integrase/recombinase XerD|nr:tyrosine-type recombinase/integrase [Oscillospiraceae bacterium]
MVQTRRKLTIQPKGGITLEEGFEQFCQSKAVMNAADDTIKHYRNVFRYFLEFYGAGRLCSEVRDQTIIEYLAHIRQTKPDLASKTVNTYTKGLRAIFYYMMKNGWMSEFKITLPRVDETIKETYTDFEVQQLIKKPDTKGCSFAEFRNWAMVCYFLATGNRLSTVRNLKISDIDFAADEILIRKTKNRKQQIIPMSSELKAVLREYLTYRKGEPDDCLFCNAYGDPLSKDGMEGCIIRYNHGRGVTKTSIHLFRHTFAKNWIMGGGDIFRLQKILGHSTLDMVKNYVAIFGGDLKRDYDRFSALDQARATSEERRGQSIKMRK